MGAIGATPGWCLGTELDRCVPPLSFYKSLAANKPGPPRGRGFVPTNFQQFPDRLPRLTAALSARVTAHERYQHPLEPRISSLRTPATARPALLHRGVSDVDGSSFGLVQARQNWRSHMRTEVDRVVFGRDQDASDEIDDDAAPLNHDFFTRLNNPDNMARPPPPPPPAPEEQRRKIRMLRACVLNERLACGRTQAELQRVLERKAMVHHKLHHEVRSATRLHSRTPPPAPARALHHAARAEQTIADRQEPATTGAWRPRMPAPRPHRRAGAQLRNACSVAADERERHGVGHVGAAGLHQR